MEIGLLVARCAFEFLEWTEDMELKPVLAIYAGHPLYIKGTDVVSYLKDRMGEVVQDALSELKYCMVISIRYMEPYSLACGILSLS